MFQGMEYVYTVYKEKSFSKAAQKLFISQPSLSANVKRIEKKIGYAIFDRSTKPLALTECGERYIQTVEKIMMLENDFTEFINDLEELKTGSLVLGGSSLFSSWVLPPLMSNYSKKFPGVRITLIEETTGKLEQMLQSGEVDIVMDNGELDEHVFEKKVCKKEHILLAVPAKFELNKKLIHYQLNIADIKDGSFVNNHIPPVPIEKLANEPFIVLKPENDTRKRAKDLINSKKIPVKILLEVDQQMTSYNITSLGMGISFVGDMLAANAPVNSEIIYYKLDEKYSVRNIYLYWKKERYLKKTMKEFIKLTEC